MGVGTGEGSCALSVVDVGGVELSGYTARDFEFLNGIFDLHVLCTDELCYDFKSRTVKNEKESGCGLFELPLRLCQD